MFIPETIEVVEQQQIDLTDTLSFWKKFLETFPWQTLVKDVVPRRGGCGLVYELPNFLHRFRESFAVVDMRGISYAEPHYHTGSETEIYFVVAGTALIVIDNKERNVALGDTIVIPPNKAHYTIPDKDFVIAVVNTPPFKSKNYIALHDSDSTVGFDREKFEILTASKK